MFRIISFSLLAFTLLSGCVAQGNEPTAPVVEEEQGIVPNTTVEVHVYNVVDGDTIDVLLGEETYRVRLIGVDTPETVHPTLGEQPWGQEASEYTKTQLLDKDVRLEFDVGVYDRYNRILAYVWVGDYLHNQSLLSRGLGVVSTFPPNVKYVDLFVATQRESRDNREGLWQDWTCTDLNHANIEELQNIIHIGPERAPDVVRNRPYTSVEQLTLVNGIGEARLRDILNQGIACVLPW